jgi:hypothetical protein
MKRSQQVFDSMIADQTKELMASLMAESVEELEEKITAKDIEIAVLKSKLEDAGTGRGDDGYALKCANLEGTLAAERAERVKSEARLMERIRALETMEVRDEAPKEYSIDVIRDGANMARTLKVRFA